MAKIKTIHCTVEVTEKLTDIVWKDESESSYIHVTKKATETEPAKDVLIPKQTIITIEGD